MRPIIQKQNPTRSKEYLDWVQSLPCCHCGVVPAGDCHHGIALGYGESGMGTKADDLLSMPLCRQCHHMMHHNPEAQTEQWRYIAKTLQQAIREGIPEKIDLKL